MADVLELTIERPVAGGRMLARHEGRVVFVAGAIPGERVRARVERTSRKVVFASTEAVVEASPFRRAPMCDLRCGGLTYAHIELVEQRRLKAAIIVDAFRRLGGATVDTPAVEASPEDAYRLRARLHVQGGRAGLFLEGTHVLCSAAATRQMRPDALTAVDELLARLGRAAEGCEAIAVAENVDATGRVLHLEPRGDAVLDVEPSDVAGIAGITGVTTLVGGRLVVIGGESHVRDHAAALWGESAPIPADVEWARSAASFFQGNRFLLGPLVRSVLAAVRGPRVVDGYAGVGLFSVALAAAGLSVTAIEGDPMSGADLERNAARWSARLRARRASVEYALARMAPGEADTVVVDPPRTGASPDALSAIVRLAPSRVVYVSCDPATLARDTKVLRASGYGVASLQAFDLFPNTPHIETLAVFDRV